MHAKVFQLLFPLPLGKQNVFVKCFPNMGNLVSASSSFDHPKTSKIYVNIVSFFFLPSFFFYLHLLAGDPNSWRLGRIDETDHETAV